MMLDVAVISTDMYYVIPSTFIVIVVVIVTLLRLTHSSLTLERNLPALPNLGPYLIPISSYIRNHASTTTPIISPSIESNIMSRHEVKQYNYIDITPDARYDCNLTPPFSP